MVISKSFYHSWQVSDTQRLVYNWLSAFGFASLSFSSGLTSLHSGRGSSTPSSKRPYVMPPRRDIGIKT